MPSSVMPAITTSVAILGSGRMGTHIAAAWAAGNAAHEVTLCSRNPTKAKSIVTSLLAGKGWTRDSIAIPPSKNACDWNLKSGDYTAAADADVVVLAQLPDHVPELIRTLKPLLFGKGKVFLDINNPWIMGSGLPSDGPQSSIEVYRQILDDDTAKWCTGYKTIYWHTILPAELVPTSRGVAGRPDHDRTGVQEHGRADRRPHRQGDGRGAPALARLHSQ